MSLPSITPLDRPYSWYFLGPNRGKRHACGLRATCQPVAAWMDRDFIWPTTITDLSTGGVGLLLGRRFEPGAGLAVQLPASLERCEETILVKVMQAHPLPGGHWLLGCAIVSELSEETVLALVKQGKIQQSGGGAESLSLSPSRSGSSGGRGALETVVANVRFCARLHDGHSLWFTGKRVYPKIAWPLPAGASLVFRMGGPAEPECMRVVIEECGLREGRWIVYCQHADDGTDLPAALRSANQAVGSDAST
jgi:hypothetical protein